MSETTTVRVAFCEDHWARLRAAVDARGMAEHVSPSGEEATARLERARGEGRVSLATFDPLVHAHNAIAGNALRLCGPGLAAFGACPLCATAAMHRAQCTNPACTVDSYDEWLDRAADDARRVLDELQGVGRG